MAYDARHGDFVLFGGGTAKGASDETWTWNGSTWKLQSPAHRPDARWGAGMGYDPQLGVVVLYGGHVARTEEWISGDDTWTWDGADWSPRGRSDVLKGRDGPRMTTASDTLLLVGGHDGNMTFYGDVWQWVGGSWTPADTAPRPVGRGSPTVAWDPAHGSLLVFGGTAEDPNRGPGENGKPLDDAWLLRNGGWIKVASPGQTALYSNAIWDPHARSVIVMLGLDCPNVSDAAWAWDGTQWSRAPRPGITARWGAASAQAPDGHALLFGGSNQPGC